MTKFDRGTQKVHGKLSKLSLGYIKGIPFLYFLSKGTLKVQKRHKILCLFLYLISVWVGGIHGVNVALPFSHLILSALFNLCILSSAGGGGGVEGGGLVEYMV